MYYYNLKMYNGILIELDDDVLYTSRGLYSWSEWLADLGGF